jgi:hypothetical protein
MDIIEHIGPVLFVPSAQRMVPGIHVFVIPRSRTVVIKEVHPNHMMSTNAMLRHGLVWKCYMHDLVDVE